MSTNSTEDKNLMQVVHAVGAALESGSTGSLSEYNASTRLNPVCLIDETVLSISDKERNSLLQTILDIFVGQYLTAVKSTVKVGDINPKHILDQFSTDRRFLEPGSYDRVYKQFDTESLDSTTVGLSGLDMARKQQEQQLDLEARESGVGKSINDAQNLAVGKFFEIEIGAGSETVTLGMNANLAPRTISQEDIVAITKASAIERGMVERFHMLRAGELRFVRDYLLALDVIEAERQGRSADKTGTLLTAQTKVVKGFFKSLLSGRPSSNVISAVNIVSKQTARMMEVELKGKLADKRTRDKYFQHNILAMLVVVDVSAERFTIYQRGIEEFGVYTFSDIRGADRKAGSMDINSIVDAYNAGSAPTL